LVEPELLLVPELLLPELLLVPEVLELPVPEELLEPLPVPPCPDPLRKLSLRFVLLPLVPPLLPLVPEGLVLEGLVLLPLVP